MTSRLVLGGFACLFALTSGCEKSGVVSEDPPNLAPRAVPPEQVQSQVRELGEVVDTYPGDQERMVHVLTNLARHAPLNECGNWTAEQAGNAPKKPLVYSRPANISARWTSEHNANVGCFDQDHDTCCTMGDTGGGVIGCISPASCDTDQCGKNCSGGTGATDRHHLLGHSTYSGENIARGYPSARAAWCGWMNSDGHRQNIYGTHSELGVGLFGAPNSCGLYWTQAFGGGGGTIPRIPVASAMYAPPNPQNAQNMEFAANYYDVSGKPPKRSVVVVDGHCIDLNKAYGVDGNATYTARFTTPDALPTGCLPYYFIFIDDAADRHVYPDPGSLYVAVGNGQSCPAPYRATQLPADCETGTQTCTEGETRPCYTGPAGTENVGVCKGGVQTCKNGFWSSCNQQKMPSPEVCDGLDNNCDGAVDDGNPGGDTSCTVPAERGECKAGTRQCIGGGIVCVSTYTPQVEVCDGLDNDCDGVTDDGFPMLSCGLGDCFRMVPSCNLGVPQTCQHGTPTAELDDGRDNDCDGVVDNDVDCRIALADGGFQSKGARICYSGPLTLPDGGVLPPQLPCKRGVQACQPDGGWSTCTGEVGPSPEICDGIDNDCNGRTDDNDELGWQRCGTGNCAAFVQECRFGKPFTCAPGNPVNESCDGTDDDCDGVIDENCVCREGASYTCYSGQVDSLDAGVCRTGVTSCNAGQWSGCEGEISPGTEYCNQEDDDCDGVVDDDCVAPPLDAGTDGGGNTGFDAGTFEPDAGDGSGGGGCGCQSGTGGNAWLVIALGGVALAGRRRRAEG